jgi:DNA modification methylase
LSRIETIGDATLYLGDCREILPTLGKLDAVVTDPPYGIGAATASFQNARKRGSAALASKDYGQSNWDQSPPPAWVISQLRDMSQWQVIFGGNYFELPPARCWLVWDKRNGNNEYADCELAWTNLDKPVRRVEWLWHGMIRKGSDVREHPTQKPLGVMAWALDQLPDDVATVCDPFMGSGTTGVAAIQKGVKFIGIEREATYFETAYQRLTEAVNAPKLFAEAPTTASQETFATIWKAPYWNEDGTAPVTDAN